MKDGQDDGTAKRGEARRRDPGFEDFTRLKTMLKQQGFYRRPTARILAELALHVTILAGGLAIVIASSHLALSVLGLFVVTLGCLGIATNTHTSAHFATSDKPWVNKALTYFGYPLVLGFSATYWWHKHHVVHHPAPNVIGVDADVDLSPYFAYTERDLDAARPLHRFYFGLQWILLPLALGLNGVNMLRRGWTFLAQALADPERRTPDHWIDLGVTILHLTLYLVIPSLVFGPGPAFAFYFARAALMGYALFAVLAPGHYPEEAVALDPRDRSRLSFLQLQTITTINFRTGPYGRLLCSGLEFHIEHHLFPRISHPHYPKLAAQLRAMCERNGYPYRSFGWGEVLWKSARTFANPKKIWSDPGSVLPFP